MNIQRIAVTFILLLITIRFFQDFKRRKIPFNFFALLTVSMLFGILCCINPSILALASNALGFKLVSNFIFSILIFICFISIYQIFLISEQNKRNLRNLAIEIGLINAIKK